jgi:hypothetical protein
MEKSCKAGLGTQQKKRYAEKYAKAVRKKIARVPLKAPLNLAMAKPSSGTTPRLNADVVTYDGRDTA